MKNAVVNLAIATTITVFAVSANAASQESTDALKLCRDHVAAEYPQAESTRVNKIKTRSSGVNVQFSIRDGGEKFKGNCKVKDGNLEFVDSRKEADAS